MLQKVTRLDSVPTAEETVLTTEVPTKESRLYTLLTKAHISLRIRVDGAAPLLFIISNT